METCSPFLSGAALQFASSVDSWIFLQRLYSHSCWSVSPSSLSLGISFLVIAKSFYSMSWKKRDSVLDELFVSALRNGQNEIKLKVRYVSLSPVLGSTGTAKKSSLFFLYFRLIYGSYPLRNLGIRDDSYCSGQSLREM